MIPDAGGCSIMVEYNRVVPMAEVVEQTIVAQNSIMI